MDLQRPYELRISNSLVFMFTWEDSYDQRFPAFLTSFSAAVSVMVILIYWSRQSDNP